MLGPYVAYFLSIAVRISPNGFFPDRIAITSRVMFRQRVQPAEWLLNVIRPSGWRSVT